MRRIPLVAVLLIATGLVGCGSVPEPSAILAATVPALSTTPAPVLSPTHPSVAIHTATQAPTLIPSATSRPNHSPTPVPSTTPRPRHTPTFLLSPTPTPPPLQVPAAGEPLPLSLAWQFNGNGHLSAGLSVNLAEQPSFVLSSLGRTVYALTEGGGIKWNARTTGPVYALAILEGEGVAVGDDAGFVTLFDAGGHRLWRVDLASRVTALHGDWQNGLLAGGWDERLSYLSTGGHVLWQAGVGGPVIGIASLPGLALTATQDGDVRAFDPDGAEVWRYEPGRPIVQLGAFGAGGDSRILVGLRDGNLLALDSNGVVRWQRNLGLGGPIWHVASLEKGTASQIIAGTGGEEPVLTMLSAEGELRWHVAPSSPVGAITTTDLDGDDTPEILVGLASGEVQAYDKEGRLRSSVQAGLPVWGLAAARNGPVLVRADVVAWQLSATEGPTGGPWLPPPAMVPPSSDQLPPSAEQVEGQAILVFLGDVALGRTMEAQFARYGPAYSWEGVGSLVRGADLAMANLEGVLTTQGNPMDKVYLLRAHPRWGKVLLEAGLDLVTLANNHALDYGEAGLDETLATLDGLGIVSIGAGQARDKARQPAQFDLNGVRVAVLAYAAARWNGSVDVPSTERIAWAYLADVQADVRAVREEADVVVVVLHAGTEYATEPSSDQVAVARAAIDAGANMVVGHHPHVTQTVERYKEGLIVYSLGDALFDIPRPAAMRGHLLRAWVTRQGLAQVELWPFWIEDAIRPRFLDDGQGSARMRLIYP